MAKERLSTKRVLIDKTNSTIVAMTATAAFVVIFALIASKTLVSQAAYQNRIIDAKKTAVSQLKNDIQATSSLVTAYKAFVDTPQNVIGGDPNGTGAKDGDNAKVVLDALPSKYDFPALATTLEKLLTSQNVQIQSITGTDDELAQSGDQTSADPKPVAMPFQLSVTGDYQSIQKLIDTFGSSIRPFQIQTMELSGGQSNMTLTLTAQTYYQPEKVFSIQKETIR
jgi:hypothetical protein